MGKAPAQIVHLLKSFKRLISRKYKVQKMILFGSQARGEAKEGSDVDLIVVSPEFKGKKGIKAASSLYIEWHLNQQADLPVDFLCYSPNEFSKLKNRISIVSQAVQEGLEI